MEHFYHLQQEIEQNLTESLAIRCLMQSRPFENSYGPDRIIASFPHNFASHDSKWVDTGQFGGSLYLDGRLFHDFNNILGMSPFLCMRTAFKMFDKMPITCAPTEVGYFVSNEIFSDDPEVPGLNEMLEELATGKIGKMNMTKLIYYEPVKMNLDPLMTMVAVLEFTMWVSVYKELTSLLVFLVAIPALGCDPHLAMSLLIFPKGLGALDYFHQFTAAKYAGNMAVSDSKSFLEIMAIYVDWELRESRLWYGFPWQQFDKLWRDNGVSYLSRRTSLLEWKSENERTFLRPSLSKIFLTSYVVL